MKIITLGGILLIFLTSCSNGLDSKIKKISNENKGLGEKLKENSMKLDKLVSKGIFTKIIKTGTGAVATGVLAAFVYDAIKPSSIDADSKTITVDYPFFATNENNKRVPMEQGSYKVVGKTDKSISIEGNNNKIMLIKIGEDKDDEN